MDNNNIIQPTNNLGELEQDYINWCMLPRDLRVISNGECYARYGCDMPELYNRYKNAIYAKEDKLKEEPSNLVVKESSDSISNYENLDELVTISRNLSKSPFITILDPEIKDLDDLNNNYGSFMGLNNKNRRISNDFSWQLWGYSVPEMYRRLLSKLAPDFFTPETYNLEQASNDAPVNNVYNHVMIKADVGNLFRLKEETIETDEVMSSILEALTAHNLDYTVFQRAPILTESQYTLINESKFDLPSDSDYYGKLSRTILDHKYVTEQTQTGDILQYGWNPFIKVNQKTIEEAKKIQAIDLQDKICNILNLENVDTKLKVIPQIPALKPIYFVLGHEESSLVDPIVKYTKIGVCFDGNFKFIYTFGDANSNFTGITIEDLSSYKSGTIFASFVTDDIYRQIYRVFSKGRTLDTIDVNTNNIFRFIGTTNPYSPDTKKLFYSSILRAFMAILNKYAEPTQTKTPWSDSDIHKQLAPDEYPKAYEVYNGPFNQFTDSVIKGIEDKIDLLRYNIKQFVESTLPKSAHSNKFLETIMKPKSIFKFK